MDKWVLDMLQSQTGFHTSHVWRAERDLLRASSGFGKERQHLARDGGIVDKAGHFSPLLSGSMAGCSGNDGGRLCRWRWRATFCCEGRGVNQQSTTRSTRPGLSTNTAAIHLQHHHRQ
jgi:hypothetical protein